MARGEGGRTGNVLVSLTSGETGLVVERPSEKPSTFTISSSPWAPPPGDGPSTFVSLSDQPLGPRYIYTDEKDMPSLEQLLKENRVASAVIERDAPHAGYMRVIAATAIGVATSMVGWVLLVNAVSESGLRANPYTALSLALGGLVLLATLLVALYGPPRGGHSR
jgi:hypothetical protein